ncbi:MAG: gliding motility lipoprotein GldH [Saprospiraceae bacterium]
MKKIGFFLIPFLTFSISACGPNYIVEKEVPIIEGQWSYDQQLDFDFEIADSLKLYNLLLDINYEKTYPKQNLYLRIHSLFPEREPIAQVLSIDLMDKMGRNKGDCNEEECTVEILLQNEAYFNTLGKHTIRLEQFMRINPLPGITSMKLKVEDTGKQR